MIRRILVLSLAMGVSAFGTLLSDGESNEGATGDGSTAVARQWNAGGGVTMTVSGYSDIGGIFTNANTTQFGVSNIGLGVCGVTPGAVEACTFNQWQVDNATPGGRDFVLFTFSSAVDLVNFSVRQTGLTQWLGAPQGADSDWTWGTSSSLLGLSDLSGLTLHDVDGPFLNPGDFDTRTIAGATNIRSLLIGVGPASDACSRSLNSCDYFKLYDINVTPSTTINTNAVPEPASMGLLGIGLVSIGLLSRRWARS